MKALRLLSRGCCVMFQNNAVCKGELEKHPPLVTFPASPRSHCISNFQPRITSIMTHSALVPCSGFSYGSFTYKPVDLHAELQKPELTERPNHNEAALNQ